MALLTYLDASGDENQPAISCGGFIARPEQWEAFELEWAQALDDFGVKELHMKHCAFFRGEFEGWSEKDQRIPFLSRLTEIMNRHLIQSVGISMLLQDYHGLNAELPLQEGMGRPYAVAAFAAIVKTMAWLDTHYEGEPVSFVIESGDHGQGHLIDFLNEIGLTEQGISVTPKCKRWKNRVTGEIRYCYPLQACDFVAYESFKMVKLMLDEGLQSTAPLETEAKARKSLRQIIPQHPHPLWGLADLWTLLDFCRVLRMYRRRPEDRGPRPL